MEFKKPKDAGPLFIDLDRKIRKRIKERKPILSKPSICDYTNPAEQEGIIVESTETTKISKTNETIRVKGDLKIPMGEIIPFNIIVEGNLVSQENVIFQGGLHVKGRAVIGARNRLEKSIICNKSLILCEDVIIYNCVDCEGLVFIKKGVKVGIGDGGGGIASANTVYLENAEGPLRISSEKRIRIVGNLDKAVHENEDQVVEAKAR